MKSITIYPSQGLHGTITVPGDKSISHRALILASLAKGESQIQGLLLGEDVLSTMRILQQLGISMSHRPEQLQEGKTLIVKGEGLHGFKKSSDILDCGNSGTTLRLMMGLLSAQSFESILTGDDSLNKRPVDRVIKPLSEMGAKFDVFFEKEKRFVKVIGNPNLKAIHYDLPVASAQLKSAILLAGLFAAGKTTVSEPAPSRDHTERMLKSMGHDLKSFSTNIPGDFSSAAFFLVAALLVPHSKILIQSVGINPTRRALLDVLLKMGGIIKIQNERILSGEPLADLLVESSFLKSYDLKGSIIPNIIDEIPIFCVAAMSARGISTLSDAAELRVKESDRIAVMAEQIQKMGGKIEENPDGMVIHPAPFKAGTFQSHGDHRIAMSTAIASLMANSPSIIEDIECVATSYPSFFNTLQQLSS